VGFLILAILTRRFSRTELGEYFLAVAIGTIVAQATELGPGRQLIRAGEQLSRVLSLRVPGHDRGLSDRERGVPARAPHARAWTVLRHSLPIFGVTLLDVSRVAIRPIALIFFPSASPSQHATSGPSCAGCSESSRAPA
jgi:hypothetical protein